MNMDFSEFHRIETDEKSTTLRHPSGHLIKIAHKGLSPEYKKELDQVPMKMAKGGKVNYEQFQKNIKASPPSKPSESSNTMPGSPKMASMAYTEPQDGGTDVVLSALHREAPPFGPLGAEEKQHYPPCINPSCKSYGKSHPNCKCYGGVSEHTGAGEAGMFAHGGDVENKYFCNDNRAHYKDCEFYKGGQMKAMPKPKIQGFPDGGEVQDSSQEVQPAPTPPVNLTAQDVDPNSSINLPDTNPNKEWSGSYGVGSGSPDQTPTSEEVPEEPKQVNPMDMVQSDKQRNLAMMHAESNMFENDLASGQIKPETYHDLFDNKSLPAKIGTIFGMLVGGMGSGLTGQPNALLGMMNQEIQNDLKKQELNQSNKRSLMQINGQNLMNLANAGHVGAETKQMQWALANDQANMINFHKLVKYNSALPPGPLKDQGNQTLAMMYNQLKDQKVGMFDRAASAAALGNMLNGGGANKTGLMKSGIFGTEAQEMGKDIESKTIPGIPGRASYSLDTPQKESITKARDFDGAINDLIDFTKKHPTGVNPFGADWKDYVAKAGIVQGMFRDVTHGGVYKSGEQDFINKLIPEKPKTLFNATLNLPKLMGVKKEMLNQADSRAKNLGFDGFPRMAQDGKMYIKSKDGKRMIPVKE